jgi:hypothetical protein
MPALVKSETQPTPFDIRLTCYNPINPRPEAELRESYITQSPMLLYRCNCNPRSNTVLSCAPSLCKPLHP